MARSVYCECNERFTCRHCLANAKPYFYTLNDGSAIAVGPLQGVTTNEQALQARSDER